MISNIFYRIQSPSIKLVIKLKFNVAVLLSGIDICTAFSE